MSALAKAVDLKTINKNIARGKGRKLSAKDIKPDSVGAPVAKYIFKHIEQSRLTNNDLAKILGYASHTNMSMVRSGAARLPVVKAPLMAEALDCDKFELGYLVLENNHPHEIAPMKQLGLLCTKEERELLTLVSDNVPLGERARFLAELKEFVQKFN